MYVEHTTLMFTYPLQLTSYRIIKIFSDSLLIFFLSFENRVGIDLPPIKLSRSNICLSTTSSRNWTQPIQDEEGRQPVGLLAGEGGLIFQLAPI